MNREQIAANVAEVKRLMPDLVPQIKALHEAGLIDGWRDVTYVGPHRPEPKNSVHAGQMVLESAAALKERIGLNGHR